VEIFPENETGRIEVPLIKQTSAAYSERIASKYKLTDIDELQCINISIIIIATYFSNTSVCRALPNTKKITEHGQIVII